MKVNLFASEKEFPELAKPVQMRGFARAGSGSRSGRSYPHWKPKEEMNDKILIFEDTKGDRQGRQGDGVRRRPELPDRIRVLQRRRPRRPSAGHLFLKDTKGTGKADLRARGLTASIRPTRTTHPTASRSIPAAHSTSRRARSTTRRSRRPTDRRPRAPMPASSATSRARRSSMSTSATGFANPHGHVWDRWGQDIVVRRHRRQSVSRRALLRPPGFPAEAPEAAAGLPATHPALPRQSKSCRAGISPRDTRATCSSPTSSASRAFSSTRSTTRAPASPPPRSNRFCRRPIRTSARRT